MTPLLFNKVTILTIDPVVIKRLRIISASERLQRVVTTLSFEPGAWQFPRGKSRNYLNVCRWSTDILQGHIHPDEVPSYDNADSQSLHEESDVSSEGSFSRNLLLAIGRFSSLRTIHISYPQESGTLPILRLRKYGILDADSNYSEAALHVSNELLSHIVEDGVPSLRSLSLHQLKLSDMDFSKKYANQLVHATPLQNLTSLEIVFSQGYPGHVYSRRDGEVEHRHALLSCLLQRCDRLTSLHISFNSTTLETIYFDSPAPNLTKLKTVKLQNLAISEPSLRKLLTPSADTLSDLTLEDIGLFEGSWASFYLSLIPFRCIMEMESIGGRDYRYDERLYTAADGNSFHCLFETVEARRFAVGLPSMRDEITAGDASYVPDFSTMEN